VIFNYLHGGIKVIASFFVMGKRKRGGRVPDRGRNGQTMIEYVVIAAMLVLSLSLFAVFLYAFKEHGGRVLDLVALDYP